MTRYSSHCFHDLTFRQVTLLFILTLSVVFSIFAADMAMVIIKLAIKKDLVLNAAQTTWLSVNYYLFALIAIIPGSRYADEFGYIRMLLLCLLLYTAGYILLSIGLNMWLVEIGRALSGLGSGAAVPISSALIHAVMPRSKRSIALIVWSALALFGLAMGGLFGGLFADTVNWRLLFWILLGFNALNITLCFYLMPFEKLAAVKPYIDYLGILLFAVFAASCALLFLQGESWGWQSPAIITFYALCPATLLLLICQQLYVKKPFLHLKQCANISFITACALLFVFQISFVLNIDYYAMYAHHDFGLHNDMCVVAAMLLPYIAAPCVFIVISHKMIRLLGYVWPILMGCGLAFVSSLLLMWLGPHTSYVNIWWRLLLGGFSLGLTWIILLPLALRHMSPTQAGFAVGTFESFRLLAIIVALGIAHAIFEVHFHHALNQSSLLFNLPPHIIHLLRDALSYSSEPSLALLHRIPQAEHAVVTQSLQYALRQGYNHVLMMAMISAAVALGVAVIAVILKYLRAYKVIELPDGAQQQQHVVGEF